VNLFHRVATVTLLLAGECLALDRVILTDWSGPPATIHVLGVADPVTLPDYLKGVLNGELGTLVNEPNVSEGVKAQAIAARTKLKDYLRDNGVNSVVPVDTSVQRYLPKTNGTYSQVVLDAIGGSSVVAYNGGIKSGLSGPVQGTPLAGQGWGL
jgi:hypothetical protein